MILQILRGNTVILTLTLMLNTLRSTLRFSATFQKHCNPLVYQILAREYSFFEKLKPAIKDIMISECRFNGKMQILSFWIKASFCPKTRRPESKRPNSKYSGGESPSVYTMQEDSIFSSRPSKKVLKFQTLNTQILNCLYNIRRFLSTPAPKIRFLASLIKIHYISLIFIHVNSVLLHSKTKRPPHILSVACCPCLQAIKVQSSIIF